VKVGDEIVRYMGIVTGVHHELRNGERLVRRELVAWTGTDRPTAVLQVVLYSDAGQFSFPTDLARSADPRGRARGTWADLTGRKRWVATDGTAGIEVESVGGACPVPEDTSRGLECVLARYLAAMDGLFRPLGSRDGRATDESQALRISIEEQNVSGVILSR
jgi:hypothetical protein